MIEIAFNLAFLLLRLLSWAIILQAVFSTLAAFGVLDSRNRAVWTIGDFLFRITDPILRPIRRILPQFGAVDLSPFVALILIQVVLIPLLGRLELAIVTHAASQLL